MINLTDWSKRAFKLPSGVKLSAQGTIPRRGYGEEPPADPAVKAAADAAAAAAAAAATTNEKLLPESQVNKIVESRIAEYVEKAKKAQAIVQQLQSQSTQTAEDKKNYLQKIDELNSALMTKEQQAAHEAAKLKQEAETTAKALETERDLWKNRYTEREITSSIAMAASANKAFDADQIVGLIGNKAKLVEAIDDKGQPTGKMEVKIDWHDVQDGKPVTMLLSPADAVKAMKAKTNYANLFLAEGGGTGYTPTRGGQFAGSTDPTKMSTEDYIKNGGRAKVLKK